MRRCIEAATASIEIIRMCRYERIGVRCQMNELFAAAIAILFVDRQFAFGKFGKVPFQMGGLEWFAQRQLFRMSDAQIFAQINDGTERFD